MPLISIIVPIYNAEKTLNKCIDSILVQDLTDIELILVDDFSKDLSRDICVKYLNKDSRVKVILLDENNGVSNARNKGLDIACGKYVMFVDSDDYVASDWCRRHYEIQEQFPNALVSSNVYKVYEDNLRPIVEFENKDCVSVLTYYDLFKMGISGFSVNKIFYRDILNKYNIRFTGGLYIGEDVVFIVKYIKCCNIYIYISKPLYYYYMNVQSICHAYHEGELEPNLELFKLRLPYIEEKYLQEYCDIYFPYIVGLFENIFDERCKKSFLQKMAYNHKVMKSKDFKFLVEHMSGKKESRMFLRVIKMYNYYVLRLFQKVSLLW